MSMFMVGVKANRPEPTTILFSAVPKPSIKFEQNLTTREGDLLTIGVCYANGSSEMNGTFEYFIIASLSQIKLNL